MATACTVVTGTESTGLNAELLEAHIVAQAITELQEIQAPIIQDSGSQGVTNVIIETRDQLGFEGQDPGSVCQTHVIYYIDDGVLARQEDKKLVDTSVQANDYEIERRSGKLPARKRIIPHKFRDYKNMSNSDTSDSDFDPNEYNKIRKVRKVNMGPRPEAKVVQNPTLHRRGKIGRPRTNFMPSQTTSGSFISSPRVTLPNAIEHKYQEALKLSRVETTELQSETGYGEEENGSEEKYTNKEDAEKTSEGSNNNVEILENEKCDSLEQTNGLDMNQGGDVSGTGIEDDAVIKKSRIKTESNELVTVQRQGRPKRGMYRTIYSCPDCGKEFSLKGNLRVHLRTHSDDRPFACQEHGCNKMYRTNESLRRHLLVHQGIKPFLCDICKNRFSSNVALVEHRSRHMDKRPYQCPTCEKCFRQVSCYRRHITTHSSAMPYTCLCCSKCFSQPAYLRSHMKVHTGEKPYSCDVCDKKFAHQSDVKRHRTTHTGEKPYVCSKCQARFSDVSSKNRHEREHENNKRYTCNLCGDNFKRSGQLRSHLNRKHSHTFAMQIERDPTSGDLMFQVGDKGEPGSTSMTQQRIVSLIKNLKGKTGSVEEYTDIEDLNMIHIPEGSSQLDSASDNVTDISQLEKQVDATVIEGDLGIPIELQGVEITGEESEQTYIAIGDLADTITDNNNKVCMEGQMVRYHVVCEIMENGQQKQVLVPFSVADEGDQIQLDYAVDGLIPSSEMVSTMATECITEDGISTNVNVMGTEFIGASENNPNSETAIKCLAQRKEINGNVDIEMESIKEHQILESTTNMSEIGNNCVAVANQMDYFNNPDFSSQVYYNWLTDFTDFCKLVPMPLDSNLFQKISHIQKSLSDVMAAPSGVVADKENFKVLMNISKELSCIINEHLMFVLHNLNSFEKVN